MLAMSLDAHPGLKPGDPAALLLTRGLPPQYADVRQADGRLVGVVPPPDLVLARLDQAERERPPAGRPAAS